MELKHDHIGRLLYSTIYERVKDFIEEHTPELNATEVVRNWFKLWIDNDTSFLLYVDIEDNVIVGHIVWQIQDVYGIRMLYCYQMSHDNSDRTFVDKAIEMQEKLAYEYGCQTIVFTVFKNARVYEKKYRYKSARTVLVKDIAVKHEEMKVHDNG